MKRFKSRFITIGLIVYLALLVACSQTPEPTEIPTPQPTTAHSSSEPDVEIREVVQTVVIPSEVVVENFIVQKRDEANHEIEIVVQGFFRNTCTAIDDISISRERDILRVAIQTEVTSEEDCEEGEIQFQEVVRQDVGGFEPGTYLIAYGPVEKFDIQAILDAGLGTTADLVEDTTSTGETVVEAEDRECEDFATFLGDVTYPDNSVVTVGETFTKTWEIRNDGDCNWGPGYVFTGVSGLFSEVIPVEDPFPVVRPTETVQLSLILTAPNTPGEASGAWVVKRPEGNNVQILNGENFDLWAVVNVVSESAAITVEETRVRKDGVVCAEADAGYDNKILDLINATRAEKGLPTYQANEQLTSAARALTSDMACNVFFGHTGSDGSSLNDRIFAEGYLHVDAAENIYYGFSGIPQKAFDWWMEHSVDSSNILSSAFTEIGVAFALNPQTGASYYTVVFAVPEAEE